jgi:hypothetical protein
VTPEERDPKVHHQTARGARLALARKEIGQESYRAVLAGKLSLARAKELGREGAPEPATSGGGSRAATERPPEGQERAATERPRAGTGACLCGCGEPVRNRFRPATTLGSTANSSATWRWTRCCGTSGLIGNNGITPRRGG